MAPALVYSGAHLALQIRDENQPKTGSWWGRLTEAHRGLLLGGIVVFSVVMVVGLFVGLRTLLDARQERKRKNGQKSEGNLNLSIESQMVTGGFMIFPSLPDAD